MIVISLLLIAVAVVLLAAGLWQPSGALLGGSIAASLLAAIALIAGARRTAEAGEEPVDDEAPAGAGRHEAPPPGPQYQPSAAPVDEYRSGQVPSGYVQPASAPLEPVTAVIPIQGGADGPAEAEDVDPPDEPAPQQVSAADAARVAQMSVEVLVVDGRPRYHLAGCVHLLGREYEPLPVGEAIELGFTPCGLCEPDSALLADARRV